MMRHMLVGHMQMDRRLVLTGKRRARLQQLVLHAAVLAARIEQDAAAGNRIYDHVLARIHLLLRRSGNSKKTSGANKNGRAKRVGNGQAKHPVTHQPRRSRIDSGPSLLN